MSCSVANLIDHDIITKVVIKDFGENFYITSDWWRIFIDENVLYDVTLLDNEMVKISRGDGVDELVEYEVGLYEELDFDIYKHVVFEF